MTKVTQVLPACIIMHMRTRKKRNLNLINWLKKYASFPISNNTDPWVSLVSVSPKIMSRIVFILVFIACSITCSAEGTSPHNTFSCGNAQVEIFNSNDIKQPFFLVKVSNKIRGKTIKYSMRNEFLFVRCGQDIKKRPLVLVNHICGGTGCDGYNFGVIDPNTLKVLLSPTQDMRGNYDQINKIIGTKVKQFTCNNYTKTSYATPQNGEFCYEAAVELG